MLLKTPAALVKGINMYSVEFPNCCTATIIYSLDDITLYEVKEKIKTAKTQGYGLLVATTTSAQKNACDVLKAAGFRGSSWGTKKRHPDNKLKLWYKVLTEAKRERKRNSP